MAQVYDAAMASVVHPRLEPEWYDALQERFGYELPLELIGRETVLVTPQLYDSSFAQGELYVALRDWQHRTDDDGLVLQDIFLRLPDGSRLAPDVAWWPAGRLPPNKRAMVEIIPPFVAEILSEDTRENDLGPKRAIYLSVGVQELWLVDPEAHSVDLISAKGERTFAHDQTLHSGVLDGCEMRVGSLFPPAERR
jgi:Uma2 family endonuclease